MTKTLSVAAIAHGTVIDHIPAGQAIHLMHLLQLSAHAGPTTVGLNLTSLSMGLKDLIKIENRKLTELEAKQISIFAPNATINIIEDYQTIKKYRLHRSDRITNILHCPNAECITQTEPVSTAFSIYENKSEVYLSCDFCEQHFPRNAFKEKIG